MSIKERAIDRFRHKEIVEFIGISADETLIEEKVTPKINSQLHKLLETWIDPETPWSLIPASSRTEATWKNFKDRRIDQIYRPVAVTEVDGLLFAARRSSKRKLSFDFSLLAEYPEPDFNQERIEDLDKHPDVDQRLFQKPLDQVIREHYQMPGAGVHDLESLGKAISTFGV